MADDNKTINPNNVTTGDPVDGACCFTSFDSSASLPDTASVDLTADPKWSNLGELSENGYTKSVSTTANKFKGWHGSVLLSKISDEENTFKCEFTEVVRESVLKLRYGVENVTVDGSGNVTKVDPKTVPNAVRPLVFDELLSNGEKMRTVFPRATIDSIDDEAHQKGSLLVYSMTFTANVDEKGRPYYIRYAVPETTTASTGSK